MKIEDLLFEDELLVDVPLADVDPLREPDALVDAAVIAARVDSTLGIGALLFDCRTSLRVRQGNVALLVVSNLARLSWSSLPSPRSWARIESWTPSVMADGFLVQSLVAPGGSLEIVGSAALWVTAHAPALAVAPPDLTSASDEAVRTGFPEWSSVVQVLAKSRTPIGRTKNK